MKAPPSPDEAGRAELCIDCRTVLKPGEPCDGGTHHRTTRLDQPSGRERLLQDVWGPPDLRRRSKQLLKAGGAGGVGGGILDSCGACNPSGLDCACGALEVGNPFTALAILAGVAVAVGLVYLISKLVERWRAKRHEPRPHGALSKPHPRPGSRSYEGTVSEGQVPALASPSGRPALAYGLTLRCQRFWRSDVLLRQGQAAAFTISLADGQIVAVPAGRVRVEGPAGRRRPVAAETVERELQRLDPLRLTSQAAEDLEPFPFDSAEENLVLPGDRVSLRGRLEPQALAEEPAGYREAPPTILVPQGTVLIRVS